MKIAIIGTGISGLTAAYYLKKNHEITVYESSSIIGGHTATIDVELEGQKYAVVTGFFVHNDWTYPNFFRLLEQFNVETQTTSMSFSVSNDINGLEYAGSNLNTLFAQRKNLLKPIFWRLLRDILRFNRQSLKDLEAGNISENLTLQQYLDKNNYSKEFSTNYLIPMGAAIWSAGVDSMLDFPLLFFIRFFKNHGLLSVSNRPQWRVIKGGSRQYLEPLTNGFLHSIRTNCKITSIKRNADAVTIATAECDKAQFDTVIFATHSDQALALLDQPTACEQEILQAIPYQNNEVILHTDISRLPKSRRAWACWNYRLSADAHNGTNCEAEETKQGEMTRLTYNMNLLQSIDSPHTFCVSLNQTELIDPSKILAQFNYSHPVFTLEGIQAQMRWSELAGKNRTWFCGAYWANGFHEDGVTSALRIVEAIDGKYYSQ
ncbi:MAG: FAD-dependent oxidoreductase [Pseudomonadota bacterium]|nr:FAD-dependent oxidoreductase [Pseudomonadota bacterium]